MTTPVSVIVGDAFRQSNLLAIGVSPTALEQDEALRYLNRIVASVFGNEAGDPYTSFPVGRNHINRPSGYPWWNDVPDNNWFVPKDTRIMLNLDNSVNLYLHPDPNNGTRFAINDASKNTSQFPVTIHGNGRLIDGNFTYTVSEDGFEGEWFYREDLSSWVKCGPLTLADNLPFPKEFDDFFITMLAMRLNPSYGRELDGQSNAVLIRSRNQLRARYTQNIPARSELGLIRPAKVAADRDLWGNSYWLYNPNSMFNKGWPF